MLKCSLPVFYAKGVYSVLQYNNACTTNPRQNNPNNEIQHTRPYNVYNIQQLGWRNLAPSDAGVLRDNEGGI